MRILLVDDETISREMMADYLEGLFGHFVVQCSNGIEALEEFQKQPFPLIISDIKMPEMNGNEFLHQLKKLPESKGTKVVLMTGYAQLDSAVRALKDGAFDYLFKPIDINILDVLIDKIEAETNSILEDIHDNIDHNQLVLENGSYINIADKFQMGVFSDKMSNIIKLALRLHMDDTVPVLIEGESGTGKELIANLVHHGFGISEKPLISINCSAISNSLFESELFGFEGGSFTGAKPKGQIGKIELANGGTLFLDEIGDMPADLQPKLLRVIQDKTFYRLGGLKEIKVDVRVIAATNRGLEQQVQDGHFRRDLFHRLNTGWIKLPSLKEQPEAIIPMAQMFLTEFSKFRNNKFKIISDSAIKILKDYEWPGNIRELRNVIERVTILFNEIELRPEHLIMLYASNRGSIEQNNILSYNNFELPDSEKFDLEALELSIIKKAVDKFNGNQTQAAKYLGISRGTLRNKLS